MLGGENRYKTGSGGGHRGGEKKQTRLKIYEDIEWLDLEDLDFGWYVEYEEAVKRDRAPKTTRNVNGFFSVLVDKSFITLSNFLVG